MHGRFAHIMVWLLGLQAALSVLGALAFGLLSGTADGMAALIGGGFGLMLTAISALRAGMGLIAAGGREPALIVAAFYRAMALKLVLAVVLFLVVARWFPGYFGPVLAGYAATALAYWIALLRLARAAT